MNNHEPGAVLRAAMRLLPSPVTVITTASQGTVRGITIGSFTSVSLEPPLISFNVQRQAKMHPLITTAGTYAVHLLNSEQAHLSEHFALPELSGEEQFATVPHRLDDDGTPILENVRAVLFCRSYDVFEAGDHSILLGELLRVEEGQPGQPLLYFNRGYHTVSPSQIDSPTEPTPKKA